MSCTVKKLYHVAAFGWYAFIVHYLFAKGREAPPDGIFPYGGPWKYLTFINLIVQMVFFGLASVRDLRTLGKRSRVTLLSQTKDLLFSVFAFPLGLLVVLLFWVIFSYDRQLVYPESMDNFFPTWANHAMHTLVLPIVLGEVLLEPHVYPKTRNGLAALGVAGFLYSGWVIWVYVSVGIWVYPLLGLFSTTGLVAFFISNIFVVILLYLLGQTLNFRIWGKQQVKVKKN
ncbi:androgen-dependent TFPI-regulating protein [Astyanax mexicanus]|uniref:Androgen-dependent TFPI-regulating protein-like n=1 Tax=Astyanax mexicanus TaxID=7994 RepID=A0A3B1JN39_ASTMX|nr:androgen-dependent TFPI-regulating protein [Astyanax mexicanus]